MAVNKAWCVGAQALMDWFEQNAEQPYYSVWRGRNLAFSWNNEDAEAGREKLLNDITFAADNGVSEVLTIKLHPKKEKGGFITSSSPVYASIDFRPAELAAPAIYGLQPAPQANNYAMQQLLEKLSAIESRLNAQDAIGELEEEAPEPESPLMAMFNNPEVQQTLVTGLVGLVSGLFAPKAVAGIAGVPEEGEVMQIVNSLMAKGVTVDHLRKLNDMGEMKLKSLLLML